MVSACSCEEGPLGRLWRGEWEGCPWWSPGEEDGSDEMGLEGASPNLYGYESGPSIALGKMPSFKETSAKEQWGICINDATQLSVAVYGLENGADTV